MKMQIGDQSLKSLGSTQMITNLDVLPIRIVGQELITLGSQVT